jgi:hypothetical protein
VLLNLWNGNPLYQGSDNIRIGSLYHMKAHCTPLRAFMKMKNIYCSRWKYITM